MRCEICIDFQPQEYEPGVIPQICGDMTEWLPLNMHPTKPSVFEFRCKVAKGYKYRFWFLYQGKTTLDYTREVSMNNEDQPTNVIYVSDEGFICQDQEMSDVPEIGSLKHMDSVPDSAKTKVEDLTNDYKTQDELVNFML